MTGIELFCGRGTISDTFRAAGHEMISVDVRRRKGVCEPTIKANILTLRPGDFPVRPGYIWASPPCNAFSYAGGNFYYDSLMPKDRAQHFIKILQHTLFLIDALSPEYFFIENPRGRMRYNKSLIDWLVKHSGMTKQMTWGSYGFPTTKPTDIFTNAHDFEVRKMLPYGRGAKNDIGTFNNLTVCQRQEVPAVFARDLLTYMQRKKSLIDKDPGTSVNSAVEIGPGTFVKVRVETAGEFMGQAQKTRL
jgi:hypothetical protein